MITITLFSVPSRKLLYNYFPTNSMFYFWPGNSYNYYQTNSYILSEMYQSTLEFCSHQAIINIAIKQIAYILLFIPSPQCILIISSIHTKSSIHPDHTINSYQVLNTPWSDHQIIPSPQYTLIIPSNHTKSSIHPDHTSKSYQVLNTPWSYHQITIISANPSQLALCTRQSLAFCRSWNMLLLSWGHYCHINMKQLLFSISGYIGFLCFSQAVILICSISCCSPLMLLGDFYVTMCYCGHKPQRTIQLSDQYNDDFLDLFRYLLSSRYS